jgi:hypothetical protein
MMTAEQIGCWPVPPRNQPKGIYEDIICWAAERGVLIPIWVPQKLIHEYATIAVKQGEEVAASHVRKLKRELDP